MVTTHNLGFPRIGAKRELKFALESYWKGLSSRDELASAGGELRQKNWTDQSGIDMVAAGDFSFYDHVLDMTFMLLIRPDLSVNHAAYLTRASWKNFLTRAGDFSSACMCSVAAVFNLALVRTGTFV